MMPPTRGKLSYLWSVASVNYAHNILEVIWPDGGQQLHKSLRHIYEYCT